MNNKIRLKLQLKTMLFTLVLLNSTNIFAQTIGNPSPLHFPTPTDAENMLFYLQRDPNTNTLIYALNTDKNGNINQEQPVIIYWIRYAEKGEKKELGYIQRKFAYGLTSKQLGKNNYELRFVSHKKLPFYLSKSETDQRFTVTTTINGRKIQIKRLFIRIEGGSFWVPNVKYASVEGTDLTGQKHISERIAVN